MAEWRLARSWSEVELAARLAQLAGRSRNFGGTHVERMSDPAWREHGSRSVVATAPAGPPEADGPFERGRQALADYAFSDPAIVVAHFNPNVPLETRRMLLELKPGPLRYLCGVVVSRVREHADDERTVFGYRYDTLEGHIERGSEWFLLEQAHATGAVRFSIEASWQRGQFPNWWSRLGFELVGVRYQRRWHRLAHYRMSAIMAGARLERRGGRLLRHEGPKVEFTGFGRQAPQVASRDS